ncbi:MAG: Amuc_1100 family pilus-like protein [Verrucomicrobiota bacterium]
MINRQKGIVIGVGVLLGVACLVIGVLFFMALSTSSEAEGKRDLAYEQLKSLYQSRVFPSNANIKRMKEDQVALEAWALEASNMLTKASIKVDDLTPVRFKQELQKTVRDLAVEKSPAGKNFAAADFKFGFDRYLGDSDSLPQAGDVAQLAQQLQLIHLVVHELYAANISKLTSVERTVFEADASEKKQGPSTVQSRNRRRPGQNSTAGATTAASDTLNPVLSAMLTRQKLTFEFQAKPSALTSALNRLAAMDAFVVVSGVEFAKSEDSILLAEQRKKAAAKAAEETKTTAVPIAETARDRMVTDPEREPPVNVKLNVDVYLFKGV